MSFCGNAGVRARGVLCTHADTIVRNSGKTQHLSTTYWKGIIMKRQVIAVVLGSLIALPAFANNEINPGNMSIAVTVAKSREQVRAEILDAQRSGNWIVNAELGTVAKAPQRAGKTRAEVRAEQLQAYRAGECPVHIANAELGTTLKLN
jgi:hypothetical protein